MLIKLTRPTRIAHRAGDVVDVSSEVFKFLVSVKAGEPIKAEPAPEPEAAEAKPKTRKKKKTEA